MRVDPRGVGVSYERGTPVTLSAPSPEALPARSISSASRTHGYALRRRNVQRFRGGLVFEAHRLVYHSTLGVRAIEKKKRHTVAP